MEARDFKNRLIEAQTNEAIDSLVDSLLFQGVPTIFENQQESFNRFRTVVAKDLGVSRTDVTVVGSARTGFSLNPQRFLGEFNSYSDIDVLIVSDYLFDQSWMDILTKRLTTVRTSGDVLDNLDAHRTKGYIYNGWIWPDRIWTALTMGSVWFDLFNRLPRQTNIRSHQFHGRLYRTWDHALYYHRRGLLAARQAIVASESM